MSPTTSVTVRQGYDDAVAATRAALADQGFGVLTEIDVRKTLKTKLDVDVSPQVILGACRPQLAHRALEADPSVAALLPCNVVVRSLDDHTTVIEAVDPGAMMALAGGGEELRSVAAEARERLEATLSSLARLTPGSRG